VEAVKNTRIVTELNNTMEMEKYIEQTILKPDASKEEIDKISSDAKQFGFFGICIPPYHVKYVHNILKGSNIKIVTVVGFPMGYNAVGAKVEETKRAIDDGADEIDMVMNITAFKNKDYVNVRESIESVATLCRLKSKIVKVIIETPLLSDEEIIKACEICAEVGVDFVKTCTGFFGSVSVHHVTLMRSVLPEKIKIKASGGIRDYNTALALIEAGANRIGTSSGCLIVNN